MSTKRRTFRDQYLISDCIADRHLAGIRKVLLTGTPVAVFTLVQTLLELLPAREGGSLYDIRLEALMLQYQIPGDRATELMILARKAAWWRLPVDRHDVPQFDPGIDLEEILTALVYEDGNDLAYAEYVTEAAELTPYFEPKTDKNRKGFCHDTLIALVEKGPLHDGDIPSKSGRDGLVALGCAHRGLCDGEEGYNYATYLGVQLYLRALKLPPEMAHYPLHEAIAHRKAQHALRKMQSEPPKQHD